MNINKDDLINLYGFLQHTAEGNLKKMLVDKSMTETHFRILLKISRNCTQEQFITCFEKEEIPKVKLSSSEHEIRETFWGPCLATLESRGLISKGTAQEVAAPAPKAA